MTIPTRYLIAGGVAVLLLILGLSLYAIYGGPAAAAPGLLALGLARQQYASERARRESVRAEVETLAEEPTSHETAVDAEWVGTRITSEVEATDLEELARQERERLG